VLKLLCVPETGLRFLGKQVAAVSSILDAIVRAYASLAVVPFITFALVWVVVYALKKEKKFATTFAMDVTTVLLIGVVSALYNRLFQSTFGLYLLLLLFLIAFGFLGNIQQRSKGKVDLRRIVRAIWRLGFLGLSAAYILLVTIGMAVNFM
jgi:hypothetical protein